MSDRRRMSQCRTADQVHAHETDRYRISLNKIIKYVNRSFVGLGNLVNLQLYLHVVVPVWHNLLVRTSTFEG